MNIKSKEKKVSTRMFSSLQNGDVFRFLDSPSLWMKSMSMNAISLHNGVSIRQPPEQKVEFVNGAFVEE